MAIPQSGGAFITGGDYQLTGNWDFSKAASLTQLAGSITSGSIANGAVGSTQLANNAVGSTQLAASVIQQLTGILSAANIIAMFTTPVTLIPAPGAGFALNFLGATFEFIGTSTQFTGGGTVELVSHGLSVNLMAGTIAAATIQANATAILQFVPVQTAGGTIMTANVGIDITNATAAFAVGTGTMKWAITYQVMTL